MQHPAPDVLAGLVISAALLNFGCCYRSTHSSVIGEPRRRHDTEPEAHHATGTMEISISTKLVLYPRKIGLLPPRCLLSVSR